MTDTWVLCPLPYQPSTNALDRNLAQCAGAEREAEDIPGRGGYLLRALGVEIDLVGAEAGQVHGVALLVQERAELLRAPGVEPRYLAVDVELLGTDVDDGHDLRPASA